MVKIVKAAATGPEIVTIRDLIPGTGPAATAPAAGASNPVAAIESSVNTLDKYISLADRGVTLLGKLDSIVGKVQARRAPAQPPQIPVQRETQNFEYVHGTPGPAPVTQAAPAPTVQQQQSGPEISAPISATAPAPAGGGINLAQILQVLDMIDKVQPGITVRALHETIARNPEGVARIITTYTGGLNTGGLKL